MGAELTDLHYCMLTLKRIPLQEDNMWVRYALQALTGIRQFALMGTVCTSLPCLVLYRGSDVLNICFNTIATLFILEADNLVFEQFLSDKVKGRVDEFAASRLWKKDKPQMRLILFSKRFHSVSLIIAVLFGVWLAKKWHDWGLVLTALTPATIISRIFELLFYVGGVCELFVSYRSGVTDTDMLRGAVRDLVLSILLAIVYKQGLSIALNN